MVYLTSALGLRWSEVAGLRVGRLDLLRRKVTVTETLAEVRGHLQFADVKTKAARRTLDVPDFLAVMLAEHLTARGSTGDGRTRSRSCQPRAARYAPPTSASGYGHPR